MRRQLCIGLGHVVSVSGLGRGLRRLLVGRLWQSPGGGGGSWHFVHGCCTSQPAPVTKRGWIPHGWTLELCLYIHAPGAGADCRPSSTIPLRSLLCNPPGPIDHPPHRTLPPTHPLRAQRGLALSHFICLWISEGSQLQAMCNCDCAHISDAYQSLRCKAAKCQHSTQIDPVWMSCCAESCNRSKHAGMPGGKWSCNPSRCC